MTVPMGNTPGDYVVNEIGIPTAGLTVSLFADELRGTPATGLTDESGAAIAAPVSGVHGVLSLNAPAGTTALYYNRGDGKSGVLLPRGDLALSRLAVTVVTRQPAGTPAGTVPTVQSDGSILYQTPPGTGSSAVTAVDF